MRVQGLKWAQGSGSWFRGAYSEGRRGLLCTFCFDEGPMSFGDWPVPYRLIHANAKDSVVLQHVLQLR